MRSAWVPHSTPAPRPSVPRGSSHTRHSRASKREDGDRELVAAEPRAVGCAVHGVDGSGAHVVSPGWRSSPLDVSAVIGSVVPRPSRREWSDVRVPAPTGPAPRGVVAAAAAGAPARRRRARVLPRGWERARRVPRPHRPRRREGRHRHHDRRRVPTSSNGSCARGPTRSGCRGSASAPIGCRKARHGARDHDVPRRGVPAREPQARGDVLRRHRDRPLATRLHRERDGVAPPRSRARRSVRWRGRPRRAPAAHAAGARGVVPRRPVAHAARGALRRAVRARTRPRARRRGRRAAAPAGDRRARSASATSSRSCSSSTTRAPGSGSWPRPTWPTSSSPSSTACGSSRTRSTPTRTCSRTRSRWCATRGPSSSCASPRCSTTSASPRRARSPMVA